MGASLLALGKSIYIYIYMLYSSAFYVDREMLNG